MLLNVCQPLQAGETFTMAFHLGPEDDPLIEVGQRFFTEAFRRLGLDFAYEVYPKKRCSVMVDKGILDGVPTGPVNLNETYPNMIRVEEPVLRIKYCAYATKTKIRLYGWESLKGSPYRVEAILGFSSPEKKLPQVVKPEQLSYVNTVAQGLNKLRTERTDIFIHIYYHVQYALNTPQFQDEGIVEVGVMQESVSFPFLHRRHADLAPKLANVMKQMQAAGMIERHWSQIMEPKRGG